MMGINIQLDVFSYIDFLMKAPVMKHVTFLAAFGLHVSATANVVGGAPSVAMVTGEACPGDRSEAYGIEVSRHGVTGRTAERGIVRLLDCLGE